MKIINFNFHLSAYFSTNAVGEQKLWSDYKTKLNEGKVLLA